MAQCSENCEHKARYDKRVELLRDRLAVLLVVVKQRYGTDWEPWFGEGVWEEEDRLADEIRGWPEYKEARDIVKLFVQRSERQ
jgi:hypothetical protein